MTSATKQQARRLQTACDRCYRLKERCARQSITDVCARCDRLGVLCATVRPPRPSGRRPKEHRHVSDRSGAVKANCCEVKTQSSPGNTNASSQPLDIGNWINGLADLNQDEKEKLLFLLDRPENLDSYIVSPIFQDAERRSLAAPLRAALPMLKDAYLACAGALKLMSRQHEDGEQTDDDRANLAHAAAAVKILRAMPVSTPKEAALCLALGTQLTLYVYSSVGHGVLQISQHCLTMARPFIETDMLELDAEPWVAFLILLEMMDCLVHRKKPTIRAPRRRSISSEKNLVDRHLGLCVDLLPYYHDLCMVSYSLNNETDDGYMALILKQLGRVQAEVAAWQPSEPEHFVDQYKSADAIHILAQARMYRLAALLVGHRLRYTFGEQDDQASIWASEIMNELELVRRVTKRPARCVTPPFVVAAIEMRDLASRNRALQNADYYIDQYAPVIQKVTKTFLSRVWWERDNRIISSWFESSSKPCPLMASIDKELFGH